MTFACGLGTLTPSADCSEVVCSCLPVSEALPLVASSLPSASMESSFCLEMLYVSVSFDTAGPRCSIMLSDSAKRTRSASD